MEINVLIYSRFEAFLEVSWLRSIAEQVLQAQDADPDTELGLVITNQDKVQALNKNYLGRDEPTDVLSFHMSPSDQKTVADAPTFVTPPDGVLHLGEVIISYPQAVIQAGEHQHSVSKEIVMLIIHGVLHLLGYDHSKPGEEQMSAREAEILSYIKEKL